MWCPKFSGQGAYTLCLLNQGSLPCLPSQKKHQVPVAVSARNSNARPHRLTQENWYATAAQSNQQNGITYGYDTEGNLTSIVDDFSSYSFTYDDIYRLTQEAGTNSVQTPGSVDVTLDYTYDNASNRLTMSETIGGQAT